MISESNQSAQTEAEGDDIAILRTVILPEFTPEQLAYLDERMTAARFRPEDDQQRVGGVFTGPWPRYA